MRGKDVRLSRILDKDKALIIPMDHGITVGPVKGLKWSEMKATIKKVVQGGATAILFHKGIFRLLEETPNCGMILHLSASTKLSDTPNWKVIVASIEEAVRLGVDAIRKAGEYFNMNCPLTGEYKVGLTWKETH